MILIAICIATYNRPAGLKRLLHSLINQQIDNNDVKLKIAIADNDSSGPNKEFIDQIQQTTNIPISYGVEPIRGIANARNRSVQLAGDADFYAFIDDDEIADPKWITELIECQKEFQADVVSGPLITDFETRPPKWIINGKFFDRPVYETGTQLNVASSGNVLVKASCINRQEKIFNETLGLVGGEDSLFFRTLFNNGAKMVFSKGARVTEFPSPKRITKEYLFRRALSRGFIITRIDLILNPSKKNAASRFFKAFARLGIGAFSLLPNTILLGYAGWVKSITEIITGVGELKGFLGKNTELYKKMDGN